MLFVVKLRWWTALIAAGTIALAAITLRAGFGMPWKTGVDGATLVAAAIGLAAILASDGIIHGALWFGIGEPYRRRYVRLVQYFAPQRAAEIVASGPAAAAEEFLFRGILVGALIEVAGAPPWLAVAAGAVAFALAHWLPKRGLGLFAVWAAWEGAMLGAIYLSTDSLIATALAHGLHDVAGFAGFAFQRRTGFMLPAMPVPLPSAGGPAT